MSNIIAKKDVESYNKSFSKDDMDTLVEDLKNKENTTKDLMNMYYKRNFFVPEKNRSRNLLNIVCERDDPVILYYIWNRLGSQYEYLMDLDMNKLIQYNIFSIVIRLFLVFGDDYHDDKISKLKTVNINKLTDTQKHDIEETIYILESQIIERL